MKIAIDGPAGAGKSTIAKLIAQKLGFLYIDTGAMYRALTWRALKEGVSAEDQAAIINLAESTRIHFEPTPAGQKVLADGENITEEIRSPEVSAAVSIFASNTQLRKIMVKKQQEMAAAGNVVMDGRDIGKDVLPDADFKFFITASSEERARRRIAEMKSKGYTVDETTIKNDMEKRDKMDMEREAGALTVLPESIVIDTSRMEIGEVLNRMLFIIGEDGHVI